MSQNTSVYLQTLGIVCALGEDKTDIANSLFETSPDSLSSSEDFTPGRELPLGKVNCELPSLSEYPPHQQTRSNQLLLCAFAQIKNEYDRLANNIDPSRIGIVLGASTSGIAEAERAFKCAEVGGELPKDFSYLQQEMSSPAQSLASWLELSGPAFTISTACSSGAKALASARRLLRAGWCDLVIAGGVDALCGLTVNGFDALDSISDEPCLPFSKNRRGINIGEGAALFLLSKESGPVELAGVGESSDAHHISAPEPEGKGAEVAMVMAMKDAGVSAQNIQYLNLHGTATPQNDRMESKAVNRIFGDTLSCSSTKGYTGHALGAAGAIEAGFCWLAMTYENKAKGAPPSETPTNLPIQKWDGQFDSELSAINIVAKPTAVGKLNYTMSNSFAFGGNNISLVFKRT